MVLRDTPQLHATCITKPIGQERRCISGVGELKAFFAASKRTTSYNPASQGTQAQFLSLRRSRAPHGSFRVRGRTRVHLPRPDTPRHLVPPQPLCRTVREDIIRVFLSGSSYKKARRTLQELVIIELRWPLVFAGFCGQERPMRLIRILWKLWNSPSKPTHGRYVSRSTRRYTPY